MTSLQDPNCTLLLFYHLPTTGRCRGIPCRQSRPVAPPARQTQAELRACEESDNCKHFPCTNSARKPVNNKAMCIKLMRWTRSK